MKSVTRMTPDQKINKLNQELILDHDDFLELSLCDDIESLDYLIDLMTNHPILRKPKRVDSFNFSKSKLVEGLN